MHLNVEISAIAESIREAARPDRDKSIPSEQLYGPIIRAMARLADKLMRLNMIGKSERTMRLIQNLRAGIYQDSVHPRLISCYAEATIAELSWIASEIRTREEAMSPTLGGAELAIG